MHTVVAVGLARHSHPHNWCQCSRHHHYQEQEGWWAWAWVLAWVVAWVARVVVVVVVVVTGAPVLLAVRVSPWLVYQTLPSANAGVVGAVWVLQVVG